MKKLVSALYTQADIDNMSANLVNATSIAASKGIGLDMDARKKLRKMGTARQGYTNLILPIAINNINALPRDTDPQQLADMMSVFRSLGTVRGQAQKILEWLDDTMMALGIDATALTDSIASSLQNARRNNDVLDNEMGEVDDYNSRFGKQMDDEDNPVVGTGTDAAPATPANGTPTAG